MCRKIIAIVFYILFISSIFLAQSIDKPPKTEHTYQKVVVLASPNTLTTMDRQKQRRGFVVMQDGDYQPIINLTSSGVVFKDPIVYNLTYLQNITNASKIAVSKHPTKDLYAIAILDNNETAWFAHLYILNASTTELYYGSKKHNVSLLYCGGQNLNIIDGNSIGGEVKDLDVLWKNKTTIVIAYGLQDTISSYYVCVTYYNYNPLNITNGSFASARYIYYSRQPLITQTSAFHEIVLFRTPNSNATRVFWVTDDYQVAGSPFKFYGITMNDTDHSATFNIFTIGTYDGKPLRGYVSNVLVDDRTGKYHVATSVGNYTQQWWWYYISGYLYVISLNDSILNNDSIDPRIFDELDSSDPGYNYLPLTTEINWINNRTSIVFSTISYDGRYYYLTYFEDEVDSLGKPINALTIESDLYYSWRPQFVDNNETDNATILFWYDATENRTIKSMSLEYIDGSFQKKYITTCLNVTGKYKSYDVALIPNHRMIMIYNETYSVSDIANNSILLIVLSNATGNTSIYFPLTTTIGLRDTDFDFLGDSEEVFYEGNISDNDTDNDWILDGSEVYIYHTKVNKSDTDNDSAFDGEEVRGINIPGVGIRQTDPLDNDTDDDGVLDGVEAHGKTINTVVVSDRILYADPRDNDTDNDGLSDYEEMIQGISISVEYANYTTTSYITCSDPLMNDSDDDQLNDPQEYLLGSDPLVIDTDFDNLSDYLETIFRTDIVCADSDHDLLIDSEEVYGVNITNPHTNETYTVRPDPWDSDTDNDGLLDGREVRGFNLTIPNIYNNTTVQTDPMDKDCDRDGLLDYDEVMGANISGTIYYTDPWDPDTDDDGLSDGDEKAYGTSPLNNDTDNDRLLDGEEVQGINITNIGVRQTDPLFNDTDGDGLSDYEEAMGIDVLGIGRVYTDPTLKDTDGDGLVDYNETHGFNIPNIGLRYTDPTVRDTDGDGLMDYDEVIVYSTDPLFNDTDHDGLIDGDEVIGFDITGIGFRKTDPTKNDTDGDGLTDYNETKGFEIPGIGFRYTDPIILDTDGDGLNDSAEYIGFYIPIVDGIRHTDPTLKDTDDDGLNDFDEVYIYLTDPTLRDSDGDGLLDGEEIAGFNITGIGFRKTDPTKNDTDGDGLSDYNETQGIIINGVILYSDPQSVDTDSDGIRDYNEIFGWDIFVVYMNGTNKTFHVFSYPNQTDSDLDGLLDNLELYHHGSPLAMDTDGDGLSDYEEYVKKTCINIQDSDGDGLSDYEEVSIVNTDPMKIDTDGDGLSDYEETVGFNIPGIGIVTTDPTKADTDGDGLNDYEEVMIKNTDPTNIDTDGDNFTDYEEIYRYNTYPTSNDSDGDGLSDYEEIIGMNVGGKIIKTDPMDPDSDDDGLNDSVEISGISIPNIGTRYTDPNNPDTDGDRLMDLEEIQDGTDPTKADTDGDGLNDYEEVVIYHTNPLNTDTDGDHLDDYEEVKIKGTDPNSVDTDGDFIPDNIDIPFPTFNNLIIALAIALVLMLYKAYTYGAFRDWRKDVFAFGLSDVGGVSMFAIPEDFETKYDVGLISSGLLGIHTMTSEISGRELKQIVLSGEVPIFIRKGENSISWVFLRRVYPRLIKQLSKIHSELEEIYGPTLTEWSGLAEDIEEVKVWVASRLKMRLEREISEEEVSPEVAEEFERVFGHE